MVSLKIELEFENLNRCQRNWIPDSVTEKDRKILENVANATPTKQNVNYFKILSISNQEIQNHLFYLAHSESNQKYLNNYNTQMLAPLLFCWVGNADHTYERINKKQLTNENLFLENLLLNAGISAGAVLTAANSLNYDTGFCKCFNTNEMHDYFKSLNVFDEDDTTSIPILFLGIGHADPNLESNICYDGENIYTRSRKLLERKPIIRL